MRIKFEFSVRGNIIFKGTLDENTGYIRIAPLVNQNILFNEELTVIQKYCRILNKFNSSVAKNIVIPDRYLIKDVLKDLSAAIKDSSFDIYEDRPDWSILDSSYGDIKTSGGVVNGYNTRINSNRRKKEEKKNIATHKFEDIVGMDKVKDKLYDVIDQFKNKEKYEKWGVKQIRSVLLYGAPGTGKTYISEALANEIDAYFEQKNIADIFQKYVGESEKVIKQLFEDARNREGNTVIFIDEIDSVAKKRNTGENAEARNSILNELLSQMSSSNNDKIFLIFATNMLQLLDPAFLRSGRVDFKIEVPLPDINVRKGILEIHSKKRPQAEDVDLYAIAKNMSGRNCADVELVANEAARRALKAGKDCVEQIDYINAYEEQVVGSPDKDRNFEEFERKIASIHEVGHLVANQYLCKHRAVKRISILPRGGTLGYVHFEDIADDKYLSTKQEILNDVISCLAGRAAEEVFYGKDNITTGASNDIEKANSYIRSMVTEYGMDEDFGLLNLHRDDILTEAKASKKIKEILEECYSEAMEFITDRKDTVKYISDLLLEKEELDEEELSDMFALIEAKKMISN